MPDHDDELDNPAYRTARRTDIGPELAAELAARQDAEPRDDRPITAFLWSVDAPEEDPAGEGIPLPYPHVRVTARLYRLAERHAAVYYATVPLWWARWRYLSWRIRRDARLPYREAEWRLMLRYGTGTGEARRIRRAVLAALNRTGPDA
jgi:hypothetical protein